MESLRKSGQQMQQDSIIYIQDNKSVPCVLCFSYMP